MNQILWLVFAIASAAWAVCPSNQPKNATALLQLEQTWAKALEQRDSATISCLLADEFQDAGVDGALHDRAETLARGPNRRLSQNHLEDVQVRLYGDSAVVRGLNRVTDASGKVLARVRFTDVFIYRDARWQAVAGHETLLTGQP